MADTISKSELIRRFADTMGVEKATDLISEITSSLGFAEQDFFNKREALQMCDSIREKGGMVGITAGFIAAELHLMGE